MGATVCSDRVGGAVASVLTVGVEPDVGTSVSISIAKVGRGVTMRGAEVGAHVHRPAVCSEGRSVFSVPRDRRGLDWPLVDASLRAGKSQRSCSVIANVSSHSWRVLRQKELDFSKKECKMIHCTVPLMPSR